MKKSIVSLLTLSIFGLSSIPVFANHENVMINEQSATITNNNDFHHTDFVSESFLISLSAGTTIPVIYQEARKILVTKDETLPITVKVVQNVRNENGQVVIPAGSEIMGKIEPVGKGSRFVAESLILPNESEIALVASSNIVTRTETIKAGKNTDAIWQGAAAGAAAATVIAGVTGDTAIATEEVLGGAGFGALAGFLFGGNDTKELISINTTTDLNLTLRADLYL